MNPSATDSGMQRFLDHEHPNRPTDMVPVRRSVNFGYDDAGEYFVGTDLDHVRTSAGTIGTSEMMAISLCGVDIDAGVWSWANTTRGSTSARHTAITLAPTARDTVFNGVSSGPGLVHTWGPNTDYLDRSPAQMPFVTVSIETEALEQGAKILGRDDSLLPPGVFKTFSGEIAQSILRNTSAFVAMARGAGDERIHRSAAAGFRDSIVADMLTLVSEHRNSETRQRMRHQTALEVVIACDDYASARRYRAITSIALSRAAGYSERRVRAAFKEMTGVSPMSYMRARALHEVRRELLSGAAGSVTDTALMWGFTELGRFARMYRDLYEELPSETLRTAKQRFGRVIVQVSRHS